MLEMHATKGLGRFLILKERLVSAFVWSILRFASKRSKVLFLHADDGVGIRLSGRLPSGCLVWSRL